MATEEGLTNAIGCLSLVFPEFLATEIARLTEEIVSATQAVTDPLAAIADTNVQGLVDDAASLSEGSIVESMGAAASGLAGSYVRREIQDLMDAMAEANPGAKRKILQAANTAEKVVSNTMLMFALSKEAPFAIAQRMCEKVIELGDLKISQLGCIKKHIVQMNNSVAALAKARNSVVDFSAELGKVSLALDSAKRDLRIAVVGKSISGFAFDENALLRAVSSLTTAEGILAPPGGDLSLLDVTKILTTGSTSASHVSTSNVKLAALAVPHLEYLLGAEISAATSVNDAINFQITGILSVLSSFKSSATAGRAGEIRARTIRDLANRVESLKSQVDAARATGSTRDQTRLSLLWASRLQGMVVTAERVQSNSFEAGSSEGPTKAEELQVAYQGLIDSLNAIDSANVTNGVDDMIGLRVLVTSIRKSGGKLLSLFDDRSPTEADMTNFSILVAQAATGGSNRIDESIQATRDVQDACRVFLTIDTGFREDFERLIRLLDSVGFDRGRDLLDAGRMGEFFDSTLDRLSYVNTAVSCLTEAMNGVDDIGTRNEIANLRDELQSRRSNELLTSADNFNFGGTKILDRARAALEDFQQKQETAKNLVEKLTSLATSLGFNLGQLGTGFDELTGNLERLQVGANGRLSADLDEFIRRPGAGVPLC